MLCLSLDASSLSASAALNEDGVLLAETYVQNGLTHSTSLLPMVDGCLRAAGCQMDQVTLMAVAAGPGSFTGVRIAVTTAMGLAGERPCACVNTLEALARGAEGFPGPVCPMLDARAGQVYASAYLGGREVIAPTACKLEEYLDALRDLNAPCLFVGDGARAYRERLETSGLGSVAGPSLLGLHASFICQIAMERPQTWTQAAALRPIYLRAPSAERTRKEREQHG